MATRQKRRVEITVFEHERIVQRAVSVRCRICGVSGEMLTPEGAGQLLNVNVASILGWLDQGRAHGMTTLNGESRICANSLFRESRNNITDREPYQ